MSPGQGSISCPDMKRLSVGQGPMKKTPLDHWHPLNPSRFCNVHASSATREKKHVQYELMELQNARSWTHILLILKLIKCMSKLVFCLCSWWNDATYRLRYHSSCFGHSCSRGGLLAGRKQRFMVCIHITLKATPAQWTRNYITIPTACSHIHLFPWCGLSCMVWLC